jgi:hypothetical protein
MDGWMDEYGWKGVKPGLRLNAVQKWYTHAEHKFILSTVNVCCSCHVNTTFKPFIRLQSEFLSKVLF